MMQPGTMIANFNAGDITPPEHAWLTALVILSPIITLLLGFDLWRLLRALQVVVYRRARMVRDMDLLRQAVALREKKLSDAEDRENWLLARVPEHVREEYARRFHDLRDRRGRFREAGNGREAADRYFSREEVIENEDNVTYH